MKWNGTVSFPGATHISADQNTAATAQPPISRRLTVDDAIADITHRLNAIGAAQPGPQAPDADVHDVAARIELHAPHIRQQLSSAAYWPLRLMRCCSNRNSRSGSSTSRLPIRARCICRSRMTDPARNHLVADPG